MSMKLKTAKKKSTQHATKKGVRGDEQQNLPLPAV
jgi:hypothetical protein